MLANLGFHNQYSPKLPVCRFVSSVQLRAIYLTMTIQLEKKNNLVLSVQILILQLLRKVHVILRNLDIHVHFLKKKTFFFSPPVKVSANNLYSIGTFERKLFFSLFASRHLQNAKNVNIIYR